MMYILLYIIYSTLIQTQAYKCSMFLYMYINLYYYDIMLIMTLKILKTVFKGNTIAF